MIVRDYRPEDFEAVKVIHEASGIDYTMPDLNHPLFLVTKVMEDDTGAVRAALGSYIQTELFLWIDQSGWGSPEQKIDTIRALDKAVREETWLKGVDSAVLYLPPGMERFGKRLKEDFGFEMPRNGWTAFSRPTGAQQ